MIQEQSPVIHIVDDDSGMRKSLAMLIQSAGLPFQSHDSAEQFLREADLEAPGCIVLDLRMPGMSGIELLQHFRAQMVETPVILISAHADVAIAVHAMKLGAIDLLQKPVEPRVLIETVRGSLELSLAMRRRRCDDELIRQRFRALTPRESELIKLIVDGRSNKQIAIQMGISIKTVANHRASLMTKTGASNAADLARLYTISETATLSAAG